MLHAPGNPIPGQNVVTQHVGAPSALAREEGGEFLHHLSCVWNLEGLRTHSFAALSETLVSSQCRCARMDAGTPSPQLCGRLKAAA